MIPYKLRPWVCPLHPVRGRGNSEIDFEKLMNKQNSSINIFFVHVQRFAITIPPVKRTFWLVKAGLSLLLKLHLFFRSKSYKRKENRNWKLEKVKPKKYSSTFIAITKYN